MMAALKYLPHSIRLHGLALYAMTATFAPNLAIWITGFWTDSLSDWRWIYWQVIPLCIIAGSLVAWGLPKEEIKYPRFSQGNWLGMILGVSALMLIALALEQGVRLDWFNSPLIASALVVGVVLLAFYLFTEFKHPTPFIQPKLLVRRNLTIGSLILTFLLVVLMSGSMLPASYLGAIQDYRAMQIAPIGLMIALPQLIFGSLVALLLYQKWIDARKILSIGLLFIAFACFSATSINDVWNGEQFILAQSLQAIGQPMAVVSILFLMTSVLDPSEGPYFSGVINTFRVFGSLIGSAVVGQLLTIRSRFHSEMLLDHAALVDHILPDTLSNVSLSSVVAKQSLILSIADAYLVLGIMALLLIPLALIMTYVPAPVTKPP
jgi:DHA2 family multidrug resistance protein